TCAAPRQSEAAPATLLSGSLLGSDSHPIVLPYESAEAAVTAIANIKSRNETLLQTIDQLRAEQLSARQAYELLEAARASLQSDLAKLAAWGSFIQRQPLLAAFVEGAIPEPDTINGVVPFVPEERRPFLSVITRTQGRRIAPMRDTLMSLA